MTTRPTDIGCDFDGLDAQLLADLRLHSHLTRALNEDLEMTEEGNVRNRLALGRLLAEVDRSIRGRVGQPPSK